MKNFVYVVLGFEKLGGYYIFQIFDNEKSAKDKTALLNKQKTECNRILDENDNFTKENDETISKCLEVSMVDFFSYEKYSIES
jgi:hypothetical protein